MQQHPELQRFVSKPTSTATQPQQQQVEHQQMSASNDSSSNITNKPVPEDKLESLQLVVNSIDHYSVDMEDLARQQALDPVHQPLKVLTGIL